MTHPAAATYAEAPPRQAPPAWLGRLWNWHEDTAVVSWWLSCFGPLLRWLTPRRRRTLLTVVAVVLGTRMLATALFGRWGLPHPVDAIGIGLALVFLFLLFRLSYVAAVHFASLPPIVRRHPQITFHLLFWSLLVLVWTISDATGWRGVLLAFTGLWSIVLWRLSYTVLAAQRGRVSGTRFTDHLLYLMPCYPGYIPVAKGLEYLARHEAEDETALARSQLAGIKLLLLALMWKGALSAMNALVYGDANSRMSHLLGFSVALLPRTGPMLAQGADASIWISWAGVYCNLIREVLETALGGHVIVGALRFAGFNVFRITYRPLLSQSVVQFWGRFDYYFKEILVDFFFLPTFSKWFRKHPALRLFVAVFAAAFVGNMYVHLLALPPADVLSGNVSAMWGALHSRLFYCLLLTVGIFLSMRAEQTKARTGHTSLTRRIANVVGVCTFFALVRIWDHNPEVAFLTRTEFFLGLFGLNL